MNPIWVSSWQYLSLGKCGICIWYACQWKYFNCCHWHFFVDWGDSAMLFLIATFTWHFFLDNHDRKGSINVYSLFCLILFYSDCLWEIDRDTKAQGSVMKTFFFFESQNKYMQNKLVYFCTKISAKKTCFLEANNNNTTDRTD